MTCKGGVYCNGFKYIKIYQGIKKLELKSNCQEYNNELNELRIFMEPFIPESYNELTKYDNTYNSHSFYSNMLSLMKKYDNSINLKSLVEMENKVDFKTDKNIIDDNCNDKDCRKLIDPSKTIIPNLNERILNLKTRFTSPTISDGGIGEIQDNPGYSCTFLKELDHKTQSGY